MYTHAHNKGHCLRCYMYMYMCVHVYSTSRLTYKCTMYMYMYSISLSKVVMMRVIRCTTTYQDLCQGTSQDADKYLQTILAQLGRSSQLCRCQDTLYVHHTECNSRCYIDSESFQTDISDQLYIRNNYYVHQLQHTLYNC